ncbi:MAG: DNA polymerase III subunit gamma/tau [Elusimicrobiota bacterium]
MYENLAAKYRPADLTEVLGQDTIKTTLANAVKLGRVAHSYVFYGPRGCGKTTIARILAKTLNCHHPKNGTPCGKCPSCVEIAESKSLDVIEIDAASNTGVDKVRSVIIEQVDFAPSRDKYKIYILDEVHMLSTGAFNALLKTVEEPPAHVVFIMATTENQKVPPTILSRSQCFRFRPLTEACMTERLTEIAAKEKIAAEPEALKLIARAADGAMRDALTMLDRAASFGHGEVKTDVLNELLGHPGPELLEALARALVNRDAAGLHSAFDRINSEGYDPVTALRNLRNLFAEAFLAAQGFSKEAAPIKGLPAGLPPAALARLSRKITVIIEEVKFSDALAIAAEIGLFTLIETPVELESLVRRLEGLEGRLAAEPGQSQPGETAEQKKNSYSPASGPAAARPVAAAPAPAPVAAPVPAPAPVPVPAAAAVKPGPMPADAWRKMLGVIASQRPAMHNALLSVKIVTEADGALRLLLANKFEVSMIEKSLPELEEILARAAGRTIKLSAELAQKAGGPAAQQVSAAPAAPVAVAEAPAQAAYEQGQDDVPPSDGEETDLEDMPPPEDTGNLAPRVKTTESHVVDASTEPELKHLAKVFHGRLTRITKVK